MATTAAHYDSTTAGRAHFKDLLDAAEEGRPASVRRDAHRLAVVDAERLRHTLARLRPANATVVAEAGGWSIILSEVPVAADGATLEEALEEMVVALREYAEDWEDHLRYATNHRENWGLVQLVVASTDQQIKDWLTAA